MVQTRKRKYEEEQLSKQKKYDKKSASEINFFYNKRKLVSTNTTSCIPITHNDRVTKSKSRKTSISVRKSQDKISIIKRKSSNIFDSSFRSNDSGIFSDYSSNDSKSFNEELSFSPSEKNSSSRKPEGELDIIKSCSFEDYDIKEVKVILKRMENITNSTLADCHSNDLHQQKNIFTHKSSVKSGVKTRNSLKTEMNDSEQNITPKNLKTSRTKTSNKIKKCKISEGLNVGVKSKDSDVSTRSIGSKDKIHNKSKKCNLKVNKAQNSEDFLANFSVVNQDINLFKNSKDPDEVEYHNSIASFKNLEEKCDQDQPKVCKSECKNILITAKDPIFVNQCQNSFSDLKVLNNCSQTTESKISELIDETNSSESEWEEVEEHDEPNLEDYKPNILQEGIEITIDYDDKRKERRKLKREREMEYVRLNINKIRRNNQLLAHKVHLLCLLAQGFYVNQLLSSPILKALALSLIPNEILAKTQGKKVEKINVTGIKSILSWFCDTFSFQSKNDLFTNVFLSLVKGFQNKTACNVSHYNLMFIVIARLLGFKSRFCMSLYPLTFKAQNLLTKPNSKRSLNTKMMKSNDSDNISSVYSDKKCTKMMKTNYRDISSVYSDKKCTKTMKTNYSDISSVYSGKKFEKQQLLPSQKTKVEENKNNKCMQKNLRLRKSVKKNYKISDDEIDDSDKDEDFVASITDDEIDDSDKDEDFVASITDDDSDFEENYLLKTKSICYSNSKSKCNVNHVNGMKKRKRSLSNIKNYKVLDDENDSDECTSSSVKKNQQSKRKQMIKKLPSDDEIDSDECTSSIKTNQQSKRKQSRRKLSSDELSSTSCFKSNKIIFWAEIFSKTDKLWIPIDCVNNILSSNPYRFENVAHQPLSYILSYDNDAYVKDITSRYCSKFMTVTRKLRVVTNWWEETLKPFNPPCSKLNLEEDEKMDLMLIDQPIPQTLKDLKDHPLYCLKRHLLKFEAIYPSDAAPVGFLRGEPIYPRDCVCKLQSREKWYKNARVVRPGEEPYKMSTQCKWDKINRVILTNVPLELFGFWQTDPYQPPIAKDGKVPRNEYGNVELFRPDMLPTGTVHIKIPNINRIARKLDIDCATAVVGFELTKGFIRPVLDGFIVCEEFKDTLIAAWEEEQKVAKEKEKEKKEKHVYCNWKKLIRGLAIRERIKLKYHLN